MFSERLEQPGVVARHLLLQLGPLCLPGVGRLAPIPVPAFSTRPCGVPGVGGTIPISMSGEDVETLCWGPT